MLEQNRNNRKQIISYTTGSNQYPDGYVDASNTLYNIDRFDTILNNQPISLLNSIPDLTPTILVKNTILPVRFRFQWNGEIIRIGTEQNGVGGTAYYYIEDNKYYRISGRGLVWAIASKLKKPIGWRVNDNFSYQPFPNEFDYGQNQYEIYDIQSYTRKTNAYLDSFTDGGTVIWEDLVGTPNNIIQINYKLGTVNGASPGSNGQLLNTNGIIEVVGTAHTRVRWRFGYGRTAITTTTNPTNAQINRQSFARINRDIWITCNNGPQIRAVELKYSDTNLPTNIPTITGYAGFVFTGTTSVLWGAPNGSTNSYENFIIPRQLITSNLIEINILQFDTSTTSNVIPPPTLPPPPSDFTDLSTWNLNFGGTQGGLGALFSDIRLKESVELIGVSPSGLNIYRFSYIGSPEIYEGVMAQELLETEFAGAVFMENGYYKVDYSQIDVEFKNVYDI
jgi:hypothetical protein